MAEGIVEIERPLRNPRLAGFYERMARGVGNYITREDLEEVDVIHNFRRRVPRVEIRECVNDSGLQVSNCWDLKITRGGLSERAFDPAESSPGAAGRQGY